MMDRDELLERLGYLSNVQDSGSDADVIDDAMACIRALIDENARLREIIYLYVDPSDVQPEHEEVVLANAASAALSPNPDQQED